MIGGTRPDGAVHEFQREYLVLNRTGGAYIEVIVQTDWVLYTRRKTTKNGELR